jgi:hypothetical protein
VRDIGGIKIAGPALAVYGGLGIYPGEAMKRVPFMLLVVLILAAVQSVNAPAAEERTLTGEYWWEETGRSGDLRTVFTPTGEGSWDVVFYFKFRGESHVYRGTARGSLSNGALSGKVVNESKRRTFTFEGTVKDGAFEGSHAEIFGSGPSRTGTLNLS